MLTSARNQFKGVISSVKKGAVNDEIAIKLPSGTEITAIITDSSTQSLGLKEGKEVVALIKASWVIIATDLGGIRLSARNQLKGKVEAVRKGAVNTEVDVKLDSGEDLTAIITCTSAEKLKLAKGSAVTAIIKAPLVIVGVAE